MAASDLILVAEDNDFVRMQIVKYLSDHGYSVLEAANGNEAIECAKKENISLSIVDVRMEPVDGFDFIRTIHSINIEIPVILVTGDNNPDLLKKAGEFKVSAMLTKPVQKDRLLKAVERTLAMKKRKTEP
ncbi:MAG: response regulator [Pseudomonadota bacterium]